MIQMTEFGTKLVALKHHERFPFFFSDFVDGRKKNLSNQNKTTFSPLFPRPIGFTGDLNVPLRIATPYSADGRLQARGY